MSRLITPVIAVIAMLAGALMLGPATAKRDTAPDLPSGTFEVSSVNMCQGVQIVVRSASPYPGRVVIRDNGTKVTQGEVSDANPELVYQDGFTPESGIHRVVVRVDGTVIARVPVQTSGCMPGQGPA